MSETPLGAPVERSEVRMANQIAANFRHHPDEQAAAEVAAHLRSFWTPKMLERLRSMVDGEEAVVDPLLRRALELLRSAGA